MIGYLIQMLIIMLVGNTNGPVNDLRKKPTREDHLKTLNCIIQRYYYVFVGLFLLGVFIAFICVCFAFVGASGVESGSYYNHIVDVI